MKIAYIFNHISFFTSHFLPIANTVKKNAIINLFCGIGASKTMDTFYKKLIYKNKIKYSEFKIHSTKNNFFFDIYHLISLLKKIKTFSPDIIHCATPKGIILGGIAARILNVKCLVIFNSGMGYFFSNELKFHTLILKKIYLFFLQAIILKHKNFKIIVENQHDKNFFFKEMNIKINNIKIIYGSGVDLKKFKNVYSKNNNVVILPARVVKEKGIEEFCKAVELLNKKTFKKKWQFYIIGALDYKKDSCFSRYQIERFKKIKNIKFLGFKKNILKYYKKAGIVCLPSYREGLSKTLIEASAMGIPVVTTNVVGCADAILPGKTGELCLPKNPYSLAKKLYKLIKNDNIRAIYSKNSVNLAKSKYSLKDTINNNLVIYKELFSKK